MGHLPLPLLLAGAVLLLAIGVAGYILLRTTGEDKLLASRIDAVMAYGRPKAAIALPSITRKDLGGGPGWKESLTGAFGFSMARRDHYTMPWWIVLGIAAVTARIAVAMGSGMFGSLAWVLMPVVTVAVSRAFFKSMAAKRVDKLRAQLPDALGLIVRAVRVGIPVTEALRAVGRESQPPTAGEFDRLANEIAIGAPLESALRQMAARNDLPEYGFFAAALGLQAQTGGGLAETLELLADVTRKRVAMKARGHALSAEARTSSMILGGLPIVSGTALYFINPDYMGILFFEESGRMVLGGALLSLCTGIFAMRMIIRKSLS